MLLGIDKRHGAVAAGAAARHKLDAGRVVQLRLVSHRLPELARRPHRVPARRLHRLVRTHAVPHVHHASNERPIHIPYVFAYQKDDLNISSGCVVMHPGGENLRDTHSAFAAGCLPCLIKDT